MLELLILLRLQKLLHLPKLLCLSCQIVKLPVPKDTESLSITYKETPPAADARGGAFG